jgi:selenide,water dikinase
MGATPIFALAIVGMPLAVLPPTTIREILDGGESVCADAGIPVAGGHSIDSAEPIYGLAAIGLVAPQDVKRNRGAQPADALVLGKPLGVGVLAAALKKGKLDTAGYRSLIETTTQLNTAGPALARIPGVHALTDVSGFGLIGHLLGMCRGSGVGARVDAALLPVLPGALAYAEAGSATGASARNWAAYASDVDFETQVDATRRLLLTDPQTSGGLLVSCAPDSTAPVLEEFRRHGCESASVIGSVAAGAPRIVIS